MAVTRQRFCPLCDKAFVEGEAVLRCEGCGVLHHPSCWVRNDGCATQSEHRVQPIAQAYAVEHPAISATSPAPAATEGVRRATRPAERGSLEQPGRMAPQMPAPAEPVIGEPGTVIGEEDEFDDGTAHRPMRKHELPPVEPPGSTIRHGRYVPPPGEVAGPVRKPMPDIYGRRRWLGLWYIPAGIILALGTAVGVIVAADRFFGGDGGAEDEPPLPTVAIGTRPPDTPVPTPTPPASAATGSPAGTTTAPAGRFAVGETVVIFGSGDCLNVRVGPARSNDAIVCLPDGETLVITGGPQVADGFTWWKVRTNLGEGWSVEDFLRRQ